jgi:hypothetical protein
LIIIYILPMKTASLLRLLLATCFLAPAGAQASTIQMVSNGGFETSSVASGTWAITSSLAGWTAGALGVEVRNHVAGDAYAGQRYVELDTTGNSWISQTLATSAGSTYALSFAYAPREGVAAASNGIEVFWNGASKGIFTGNGGAGNAWNVYKMNLVGLGGAGELKFAAVGASDSLGGALDAISVTAVPEPATLATMGFGLGLIGLFRRRRSRQ